jgi:hypothetical protein
MPGELNQFGKGRQSMGRKIGIAVAAALILYTVGRAVQARTWTDRKGRQLEAQFITSKDGNVTIKRQSDGKQFTVPLTSLSDSDQEFVRSQTATSKPVPTESANTRKPSDHVDSEILTFLDAKMSDHLTMSKSLDGKVAMDAVGRPGCNVLAKDIRGKFGAPTATFNNEKREFHFSSTDVKSVSGEIWRYGSLELMLGSDGTVTYIRILGRNDDGRRLLRPFCDKGSLAYRLLFGDD